jgi:hypothetical protein
MSTETMPTSVHEPSKKEGETENNVDVDAKLKAEIEKRTEKALTAETIGKRLNDVFSIMKDKEELSHTDREKVWELLQDVPEDTFPFKDKANGREFKIVRGEQGGKKFVTLRQKNKDGSFSRIELFDDGELKTYSRPSKDQLKEEHPDGYDSSGYDQVGTMLDSDKPLSKDHAEGYKQKYGDMLESHSSKEVGGNALKQAMSVVEDFNDAVETIMNKFVRGAMGELS